MSEDKKIKNNLTEIVLLAIPPYLLSSFQENEENKDLFISLPNIANIKEQLEKTPDISTFAKNLNETDFSSQILQILQANKSKRIIFVNYPRNKEQLEKLEKTADEKKAVIKFFVVVFFQQTEHLEKIALELKTKNIICPICEQSYKKILVIKEKQFLCPVDGNIFPQAEIEKFTDFFNDYYSQKIAEIIEHQKEKGIKIIHPRLLMKEDFEPANLRSYLLEIIDKL